MALEKQKSIPPAEDLETTARVVQDAEAILHQCIGAFTTPTALWLHSGRALGKATKNNPALDITTHPDLASPSFSVIVCVEVRELACRS